MLALKFDIRHPDGRVEELRLEGDRAMIGSGAHCEIRLPVDQAEIEHILVQATPGGVAAEARSFNPQPTVNGAPFMRTQLVPGSVLGVGYYQIVVTPLEVGAGAGPAQKEEGTSRTTLLGGLFIILVGVWWIMQNQNRNQGPDAPPQEIPELWDAPISECPQHERAAAAAYAEDRYQIAASKQERRPFHVQDGVAAVPLYEVAAACFEKAGDHTSAREASGIAQKLRKDISQDFRTHRVRLGYALSRQNWAVAQHEVRVLLDFLDGKQHDYVSWLSNIERRIRLKYGDQIRKQKQTKS
ncbi:MAG: hypothetical protein H6717_22395 [Polyangiaceae bacterium]|nr:hypothetical protein [Polyangiaceae bacterium]